MKYDNCKTGLSDYHKMAYSFSKKTIVTGKPKTSFSLYRCFKKH